ncbi:MAG: hypothetical protein HGA45_21520 [Chloroflexales bacterium]|nr:hypothetical protein [Chloroflexales bacterium]
MSDQTPKTVATVAGTTVLALPDALGTVRRITLHGNGHFTIDGHGLPRSSMVGHPDYSVLLDAGIPDDRMATVHFQHSYSWDPRYLGYENLWMLVGQWPHEFYPPDGKRIRLVGLATQPCWLTIKRVLVGDLLTDVTFVGPTREGALALLRSWLDDRVSPEWDGEAHNDHSLPFTPIWAELGGGRIAALSFHDRTEAFDDERRHTRPLIWTYRRDVPRPNKAPISYTREYRADDEEETAWAFKQFIAALRDDGDHWRHPEAAQ